VEVLLKSFKLQTIPLDKKMAAISSSYQPLYRFWSEGSHAANEAAKEVSLRNIDPITISVLNERNELMDSVEYSRAFFELYDGAIILQRGLQYQVIKLDLLSNTAVTRRVRVPYYTSGKNETQINIIKSIEVDGLFHYGVVQVVAKVNGFYKRKLGTGEIFEEGACSLPPLEYETTAIWVDLPVSLKLNIEKAGHSLHESIHACNHVLVSISPMLGQCDPRDIGTEHIVSGGAREHPLRIMLFDKRPGGLGSCAALFTYRAQVISSAMAILSGCLCSEGCPSCILEKRSVNHGPTLLSYLLGNKYLS
jgi:DEAD/DEAH box helicase domain-containing protein